MIAEKAGFTIPADKKFLIIKEENIGKDYPFSTEKLGTLPFHFQILRFRKRP